MTKTPESAEPPMTPERMAQLWDLAMQLSAADAAHRLWSKIFAERAAKRSSER